MDTAVDAINADLLDLGIDGFSVKKHSENLYRIVRAGESMDAFHSLSEGEKMIISFLYFCELCKGKSSADDTHDQRIVVIYPLRLRTRSWGTKNSCVKALTGFGCA